MTIAGDQDVSRALASNDDLVVMVRDLRVEYSSSGFGRATKPSVAVDGIDLEVAAGQTLGVVGESGSGKTTLAKAITRIIRPTSGSIVVNGIDVTALSERRLRRSRRNLQMVFQDPFSSLNPRMTIGDILAEPLTVHGLAGGAEARRLVDEMMTAVGLDPVLSSRLPHEFSGGQRQRIAIGRALIMRPDVVVCDEAVSSLDVSVQAQVLALLADLQSQHGVAYIFIAHDLAVVATIADEVMVMYGGQVMERGLAKQIFRRPVHPYTVGLSEAIPANRMRLTEEPHDVRGEPPDPRVGVIGCRFSDRCWLRRELGNPTECTDSRPPLLPVRTISDVESSREVACHFR